MNSTFYDALRLTSHSHDNQLRVTFGELTAYFAETHTGTFELPLHIDDKTDQAVATGQIPIGTMYSGAGYGMQFKPDIGAQALIIYVDEAKVLPVAAVFFFNQVEVPPWPNGDFSGIVDQYGNKLKLSQAVSSLVAPTKLELGTEGLDPSLDAVITKRTLDAALSAMTANIQSMMNHFSLGLQGGPGVTPSELASTTSTGSAKVLSA